MNHAVALIASLTLHAGVVLAAFVWVTTPTPEHYEAPPAILVDASLLEPPPNPDSAPFVEIAARDPRADLKPGALPAADPAPFVEIAAIDPRAEMDPGTLPAGEVETEPYVNIAALDPRMALEPSALAADVRTESDTVDAVPLPRVRPEGIVPRKGPARTANRAATPKRAAKASSNTKPQPAASSAKTATRTAKATPSGNGTARSPSTAKSQTKGSGRKEADRYLSRVRQKIIRAKKPSTARGTATVSFTITKAGRPSGVRIARSSGQARLDQAALSSVKRAGGFGRLPSALGSSYQTSVQIAYR